MLWCQYSQLKLVYAVLSTLAIILQCCKTETLRTMSTIEKHFVKSISISLSLFETIYKVELETLFRVASCVIPQMFPIVRANNECAFFRQTS